MFILRIEDQYGNGIYATGLGFTCTRAAIEDAQELWHPGPTEDEGLVNWWNGTKLSREKSYKWDRERKVWRCAFLNMEQMLDWFPKAGFELMVSKNAKYKGFRPLYVSTYEVPHHKVKKGTHQVMFHNDHKVLIDRILIEDFVGGLQ